MTNMLRRTFSVIEHNYDAIILGAGGSGLRCAYECAENGLKTAVVTKPISKKSHSCCSRWN